MHDRESSVFTVLVGNSMGRSPPAGAWPKWTRLLANFEQVLTINQVCDDQRSHELWGLVRSGAKRVFATSLEVHYPQKLCDAITHAFMLRFQQLDLPLPADAHANALAQAFSSIQPRSSKVPAILPEYKHRVAVLFDNSACCVWPQPCPDLSALKLLRAVNLGCFEGDAKFLAEEFAKACFVFKLEVLPVFAESFAPSGNYSCRIFGAPWDPLGFVEAALRITHPFRMNW